MNNNQINMCIQEAKEALEKLELNGDRSGFREWMKKWRKPISGNEKNLLNSDDLPVEVTDTRTGEKLLLGKGCGGCDG